MWRWRVAPCLRPSALHDNVDQIILSWFAVVECPDPNVLENGNVSPPQERYFVGNETTYECYSGYKLRGSFRRVCLSNTKWSGSTPICSRDGKSWTAICIHPYLFLLFFLSGFRYIWIHDCFMTYLLSFFLTTAGDNCADPGIPPGALRTGNVFDVGDKVKYSCNGNLFLVGSSERVCLESGQWTGQEPACYCKTDTYKLCWHFVLFDQSFAMKSSSAWQPPATAKLQHSKAMTRVVELIKRR